MNRYSEVASRYASALFELATEKGTQSQFLEQINALKNVFLNDKEIQKFISSPIVKRADLLKTLEAALKDVKMDEDLKKAVFVLAEKKRLPLFDEIFLAYQDQADTANGVTRGVVRSAGELNPEERQSIEKMIQEKTGKNVVLEYQKDASVIGGVIVQVGSYTFDDTIDSHLRRMKEELNRA